MSYDNQRSGSPREGQSGGENGGERRPRRPGGRYVPRRKVCLFCVDKVAYVDYKDLSRIGRYVSDRGKIESRRKMGTCARHQRGTGRSPEAGTAHGVASVYLDPHSPVALRK